MTPEQLRAKVKAASDKMRADDNTKAANQYLQHLSWLLFLKVFEAVEDERQLMAEIDGRIYPRVIDGEFRWSKWTQISLTGDPLIEFVSDKLLPHLRGLAGPTEAKTIATMFAGVRTVMRSGYSLAEVLAIVDEIDFHDVENAHAMSVIYEELLGRTSDAGWSGEFYTPRPIVEFMVEVIDPQLGETVYDPCSGSSGFLVVSAEHMKPQVITTEAREQLEKETFYGQESGELAFLIGTMNLLLHGVRSPRVVRRNSLEQDVRSIAPGDQHNVILTNPPFGGTENPQVQQNFPARSAATELLFLQHVMAKLSTDGRCAIVLPDGIMSREDASYHTVRRWLIEDYGIHAIVRLPSGVFANAPGTRTNLVFFGGRQSDHPSSIRYYQVRPPAGKPAFGKGDPITPEHLAPALAWIRDGESSAESWEVSIDDVVINDYALNIIPRRVRAGGAGPDPAERLEQLIADSDAVAEAAKAVETAASAITSFEITRHQALGDLVEERGARAGDAELAGLVGVSNSDGLVPFKGKVAKDKSNYRRLEVGDYAYNPMRINVGSVALCRHPEEEGWVSPDYVVFRLSNEAPFGREYLLRFLKSAAGREEIDRHTEGSVRARLYFANLREVEVPLPAEPGEWENLLNSLDSLRRNMSGGLGVDALSVLEDALFAYGPPGEQRD